MRRSTVSMLVVLGALSTPLAAQTAAQPQVPASGGAIGVGFAATLGSGWQIEGAEIGYVRRAAHGLVGALSAGARLGSYVDEGAVIGGNRGFVFAPTVAARSGRVIMAELGDEHNLTTIGFDVTLEATGYLTANPPPLQRATWGAVAVLPLVDAGHVCLLRNYRTAVNATLWEVPAGTLELDEPPADAAVRELEEETGYRAGRWRKLAEFYPSPGVLSERTHLYVAQELTPGPMRLEADEERWADDGAVDAFDRLLDRERDEAVQAVFERLPPRCKALLTELFRDPRPAYDEISRVLRIPIGSIGPTRGRCLKKFCALAEECGLDLGAMAR